MRRPVDPEDVIDWFLTALGCVFIACLAIGLVYFVGSNIRESMDKDHCGALGGKVEHYDPQHADLWRCVGARAEVE